MRRAILLALACSLAAPLTAEAGTATRGDGAASVVAYRAAPGELNRLEATLGEDAVVIVDTAGAEPGAGCERPDPADATRVRCPFALDTDRLRIDLGDRDDLGTLSVAAVDRSIEHNLEMAGGAGNDQLTGSDREDVLGGGPGADVVRAGEGFDTLFEGPRPNGSDTLRGGAGIDSIDYSGRAAGVRVDLAGDRDDGARGERDMVAGDIEDLAGGNGPDHLTGDAGQNAIEANGGPDIARGGGDADTIDGGPQADRIAGGPGRDEIDGRAGNDLIAGGGGDDELTGDRGGDLLLGGRGDDVLYASNPLLRREAANVVDGGPGRDGVRGGFGPDLVRARDGSSDDVECLSGRDRVLLDGFDTFERDCERVRRRGRPRAVAESTFAAADEEGILEDFGVVCPRDMGGRCRGTVRLVTGGNVVGRARFSLAPGGVAQPPIRLARGFADSLSTDEDRARRIASVVTSNLPGGRRLTSRAPLFVYKFVEELRG